MTDAGNACPSCGGSGGGPFGPRGGAWDVEDYECPHCQGRGVVASAPPAVLSGPLALAKGTAPRPERVAGRRGPVSTRPAAAETTVASNGKK